MFFRGTGGGEDLPYLTEYLLCRDFGWTWAELQETPADVLACWSLYRNTALRVEAAQAKS